MEMTGKHVWLITGCSSGLGRAMAKEALESGYAVAVTARHAEEVKDLIRGHETRALALELDVTKPEQVADAVEKTEKVFGHIDVLVNNAGYGYLSAIEEAEEQEARAIFETNFWGVYHMIKAVLPGMRKRRQGWIINISSIAGLIATSYPGIDFYDATKFAVEGLSESLAKEVEPLGIHVLIVEPSELRTNWFKNAKSSKNKIEDYKKTSEETKKRLSELQGEAKGDPARAAKAIIFAVNSRKPPLHLLLGQNAVERGNEKLKMLQHDFEKWQRLSKRIDFPKFRKPSKNRVLIS